MTLITWQNGGPVLRDGAIGSGQECCCGPPCQCGVSKTIDLVITLTGNKLRPIGGGNYDCGGSNTVGSSITFTTCSNGDFTASPDLDIEVCNGNDPNDTTYCGGIDIFYTVTGCNAEITGFDAPCGVVADVALA